MKFYYKKEAPHFLITGQSALMMQKYGSIHYINITGFDKKGNMQWYDPYDYVESEPVYSQSDILELKVIRVEE